jgi:hypothetical protein
VDLSIESPSCERARAVRKRSGCDLVGPASECEVLTSQVWAQRREGGMGKSWGQSGGAVVLVHGLRGSILDTCTGCVHQEHTMARVHVPQPSGVSNLQ